MVSFAFHPAAPHPSGGARSRPRHELVLKWACGLGTHLWSAHLYSGTEGCTGGALVAFLAQCGQNVPCFSSASQVVSAHAGSSE